jgi:hypothetical protein
MTKRKIEYWVIPPDQDAEFVADMENVLETYLDCHRLSSGTTVQLVSGIGRRGGNCPVFLCHL